MAVRNHQEVTMGFPAHAGMDLGVRDLEIELLLVHGATSS